METKNNRKRRHYDQSFKLEVIKDYYESGCYCLFPIPQIWNRAVRVAFLDKEICFRRIIFAVRIKYYIGNGIQESFFE